MNEFEINCTNDVVYTFNVYRKDDYQAIQKQPDSCYVCIILNDQHEVIFITHIKNPLEDSIKLFEEGCIKLNKGEFFGLLKTETNQWTTDVKQHIKASIARPKCNHLST